ncbi:MAG: nucleoside triphosphate pyrophosphatase [Gammaproteobacteria bacterium]|nr:MAG: nucleoside triphosphate pyrophosphatase [Gammaproteobacteria bacterium]
MSTTTLILASSSPYRRELLQRLQIPFSVDEPDIDESTVDDEPPVALVERLAIAKARAIGKKHNNALIIGADQVAVHGDRIVGKPHTHDNAVKQLQQASGQRIVLYTGLALFNAATNKLQSEVVPYYVQFRELSDEQIETYLHKEKPYKCAGSVKSEGLGIALLERFEGDDPNTLIGLPLIPLIRMLEQEGIRII